MASTYLKTVVIFFGVAMLGKLCAKAIEKKPLAPTDVVDTLLYLTLFVWGVLVWVMPE